MKLSAPKKTTWWIAVVVGVLGILGHFQKISFVSENDFLFVAAAFVLLALATYFKNL
jgi:predicted membrane channel-forming protein YqfA (hemolysin III family)